MTSRIAQITFDCREPHRLAAFWREAVGFVDDPLNPNAPDDPEAYLVDPIGRHPALLFIAVPEAKTVKNRLHLDLVPDQRRDAEVERLLGLGATLVDDRRRPDGTGWAVLADPEGNELCIEQSTAERPARPLVIGGSEGDSDEREMPPLYVSGEREMLEALLDWYRAGVILKVRAVSQTVASATPLRSATSIAGLVKHLALVEDSWFTIRFAGEPEPAVWADADFDADRDWEFHTATAEPIEDLVALYEEACARSRQAIAGRLLDELGEDTSGREFTLRFALLHLVEETARHLGHLDILRELLDGTTGE